MKINLRHKKNTKSITIKDMPVFDGGVVSSFKHIDVSSDSGDYTDSIIVLNTSLSDAEEVSALDTVSIEKFYNGNIISSTVVDVYRVIGSQVLLTYPLFNYTYDGESYLKFKIESVFGPFDGFYAIKLNQEHGFAIGDDAINDVNISIMDKNGEVHLCENDLGELAPCIYKHTANNKLFFTKNDGVSIDDKYILYVKLPFEPEAGGWILIGTNNVVVSDGKDGWELINKLNDDVDVRVTYNNDTLTVPVGVSSSTDYVTLLQNDKVDEYAKTLTKGIVPGFINTERTKYVPFLYDNGIVGMASKIEFSLHFRARKPEFLYRDDSGDIYGEMPDGSWSIQDDEDTGEIKYWNNFNDYADIKDSDEHYYVGDPIGKLGFTDSDVLNRKQKLGKSFLRLSFFNSKDPLQSSMLFYSTIHMNINELYSKYIKIFTSKYYDKIMGENFKSVDNNDDYDNHWGLVLFDGYIGSGYDKTMVFNNQELLTTTLTVSSEYDKSNSAEGFNLYLFSEDSPEDNEYREIYMKVEFNHAGYGRTIPMIMWPKDENGNPLPITRENYYDALYIPVVVEKDKTTNKYIYYIKGANNNTDLNTIRLALFEPKFEAARGNGNN